MGKLIFFTLFIVIFGLMNYYTYRRFLLKIDIFHKHKNLIKYLFYTFYLFIALYIFSIYYDIFNQKLLYLFSYSIGVLFILFVTALLYDLTHTIISKTSFYKPRRNFLKIGFDITFLIFSISYILKGVINGFKEPILHRVFVKIKNFKKRNFKIVQLSDMHIGNTIKKDFVEKIVERVNTLNADLIVITGDLVDKHITKIIDDVEPLKNLKSKNGVYFVVGNHEYFHSPLDTITHLKTLNINILQNQSVVIQESFNLVGLNDFVGTRVGVLKPNPQLAFSKIDTNLPSIVLAHQPKMIKQLERYKPSLILSGHTHGGQIFPFGFLVLLDQPYLSGLHKYNQYTKIFVSNGTGFWGPAIRVLADSEISEINLNG